MAGDQMPCGMLTVTWNLAGRVKRLDEQAKLLLGLAADVLCLQELTPSTLPVWVDRLRDAGYHPTVAGDPGRDCAQPLHVLTAAREQTAERHGIARNSRSSRTCAPTGSVTPTGCCMATSSASSAGNGRAGKAATASTTSSSPAPGTLPAAATCTRCASPASQTTRRCWQNSSSRRAIRTCRRIVSNTAGPGKNGQLPHTPYTPL
jgi:hypothetical protein